MTTKLTEPPSPPRRRGLRAIPAVVYILGASSLFTDIASEMIMPLRLIFLVQVLGTPLAVAGVIEGLAESATSILRVWAGQLADRVHSRRGLVAWGYGISAAAKPLLALAPSWLPALALVLVDRAGKAVRVSPRDAMIADAVAPRVRGRAFGFHRSADTLGAAVGPLVALLILNTTGGNLRAVFGWTIVPGALAVIVALLFLREKRRRVISAPDLTPQPPRSATLVLRSLFARFKPDGLRTCLPRREGEPEAGAQIGFGARFWLFAALAAVFALGNSSDAFLFLRTEGIESSLAAVPLVYFAFNLVYALLATPLGSLSDRWGRLPMLAGGYLAFTLVYAGWSQATNTLQVWGLFLLYGAYYAATEGVARAFVADLVPQARRGTAMGWYNGIIGVVALPANIAGAWLWNAFGPGATFAMGAWLGAISFGLILAWWPWLRRNPRPFPNGNADTAHG